MEGDIAFGSGCGIPGEADYLAVLPHFDLIRQDGDAAPLFPFVFHNEVIADQAAVGKYDHKLAAHDLGERIKLQIAFGNVDIGVHVDHRIAVRIEDDQLAVFGFGHHINGVGFLAEGAAAAHLNGHIAFGGGDVRIIGAFIAVKEACAVILHGQLHAAAFEFLHGIIRAGDLFLLDGFFHRFIKPVYAAVAAHTDVGIAAAVLGVIGDAVFAVNSHHNGVFAVVNGDLRFRRKAADCGSFDPCGTVVEVVLAVRTLGNRLAQPEQVLLAVQGHIAFCRIVSNAVFRRDAVFLVAVDGHIAGIEIVTKLGMGALVKEGAVFSAIPDVLDNPAVGGDEKILGNTVYIKTFIPEVRKGDGLAGLKLDGGFRGDLDAREPEGHKADLLFDPFDAPCILCGLQYVLLRVAELIGALVAVHIGKLVHGVQKDVPGLVAVFDDVTVGGDVVIGTLLAVFAIIKDDILLGQGGKIDVVVKNGDLCP